MMGGMGQEEVYKVTLMKEANEDAPVEEVAPMQSAATEEQKAPVAEEAPAVREIVALEEQAQEVQAEVMQAEKLLTEEAKESAETVEGKATVAAAQLEAVDELSPSQQNKKVQLSDLPQSREAASFVSAASQPASFMSTDGGADVNEQQAPAASPNTAAKRKRGGRGGRKGRGNGNHNQWW